jgi:hypothetical protein
MSNTLDFEKICSADEQNLRKAEVLIYSKGTLFISKVTGIHLPEGSAITVLHNMSDNNSNPNKRVNKSFKNNETMSTDNKTKLSDMKKLESITLQVDNLSQTFYPLLISFWAKIYDGCGLPSTKFKMISSLRNNKSNITSFILDNNGKMTMQIENINLQSSFGLVTNCTKESASDNLVAKIIIIYNPCQ